MLTTRKLVLSAAVLLAGLLALNLAIAYLTRNSVPRRLMRHARESESAVVLALGNSLMVAGFDEAAFDAGAGLSASRGAVNLGLGASAPVEHLLLLRYALAHGVHPHLVIYGFYDFQLTAPTIFSTSDLIGNNAMLYYVEPLYARGFYTLSRHDAFEFRAMYSFPMFTDRGAIWTKVETVRRALAQEGMPPERTNQFGRVSDFSRSLSDNADDFRRQCETSMNLPLAPAVGELVRQSIVAGATIGVVAMPMRQAHRNLYYGTRCWSEYVTRIGSLLEPYRANFIDASSWIQDDSLFDDAIHLTVRGADQFSRRLGNTIKPEFAHWEVAPTRESR
jgi:hypothetical protein